MFLNLKNPANTAISNYNTTKCICFVPPATLQEDDKTLENYIAPNLLASLPEDSYYVTLLPKEVTLKDRTYLSSCPANFEC